MLAPVIHKRQSGYSKNRPLITWLTGEKFILPLHPKSYLADALLIILPPTADNACF
jgi:hypothetical protein